MNNIDLMSDNILKTAGFVGRTLTGAMLGAGINSGKGLSANEANPNASYEEKRNNIVSSMAGGAMLGGAVGGAGVGTAKKIGKKILNVVKKAEMDVPTDEEKGLENNEARKEVEESPNEDEKNRMESSMGGNEEARNYYKKEIEKQAFKKKLDNGDGYLNDIECEQCNYHGKPEEDGRCPRCGAVCGCKPRAIVPKKRQNYSRENSLNSIYKDIADSKREYLNWY